MTWSPEQADAWSKDPRAFPVVIKQLIEAHERYADKHPRYRSLSKAYDDAPWPPPISVEPRDGTDKPAKSTLDQAVRGRRPLTMELMELMAGAVDADPGEVFLEYQLALARRQLDHREVGLDRAAELLASVQRATRTAARERARRAAARQRTSRQPKREDPPESQTGDQA